MKHLSDEQLIEIHYLGASEEAASHISACEQCAARGENVRRQLEAAAYAGLESSESRPDSFWHRQRVAIDRAIDRNAEQNSSPRALRWGAAAAVAALLMVGLFSVPRFLPSRTTQPVPAAVPAATPAASSTALDVIEDITSLEDPWEAEELRPFAAAVEWESWDTEHQTRNNS